LLLRISTAVKFFKFCWAAVVVGVSPICCFFLLSLREVVVGYGMAAVASLVAKYWWCSFSLVVVDSFSCMITDVEYLSSPSAALFLLVTVLTVALSASLESRFTPPSPVPYLLLRV